MGEMHQRNGNFWNRPLDVGNVVGPRFGIEQMSAGDMGLAALEREQTAQAADVSGGDLELGVAQFQLIFQYADRKVVAAGAENRVLDVFDRPQELDLGLIAGVQAFDQTGYPHQAVGMNHGGDHARAAGERHGDKSFAHTPQGDA